MIKFNICVFTLLYVLLISSLVYAQNSRNLISNPGFEHDTKGWLVDGDVDVVYDTQIKHNGEQSLRLDAKHGSKSSIIKVYTDVPVKTGETYRARFYVYSGPLSDGSEPYGALEFLDGEKRISLTHTDFQVNKYESNVWHRLEAIGVVPTGAKKARLSMIMHPFATVRFDNAELIKIRPAPESETNTVKLTLNPAKVISDGWRGFGCQGEIYLYLQRSIEQGINDDDRRLIINRIKAMRPKYIRLTVRLSDWENERGKPTPDNDTIKDLRKTIAIYKEVGADVQLTEWGHALPDWCHPNGRLPAPDMWRAFTDSWASLIKHLRNDCGLTNVRYVTMHNEPNNLPWADYKAICQSLDFSLKAAGIRNDIQIIGPDESNENLLLPLAIRDLNNIIDCYDAHGYTANTGSEFGLWVDGRTGLISSRKPFLITEFGIADGMDTWQTPHNNEYRYGIFLADSAIVSCNLGVSGMAMYCISDYDCGTKMMWGLWKSKDENWEPRPGFYAWSLITRYTELGSTVHQLKSNASSVPAVAFRAPRNGALTLMAVNRLTKERLLVISGLPAGSKWEPFLYSERTVPTPNRGMIPAGKLLTANKGIINTKIPPNSFILLHEFK
ncbi:MAG: carbohydrate binding domain-containing protein [Armatimonadota bacterium]